MLNPNVSPELRVRLFGAPSFEVDGAPVSVAVRPLCAVLFAMILLAEPHRRLSRKAVAVDLWPDETEEMAAANLRRHLSFLTAALPAADAYIGRDRESLWSRAASGLWCDVIEFERGDLDLYRADFMEGSSHEWVVAERERLRAVAFERLLQRAERLREASDDAGAIASARRAAEIEPCSEEAAQLEIELHGERGDLAALDAAYAAFERRLREIDAKPSSETRAIAERFHRLAQEAAERIPRTSTSYVDTGSRDEVAALVAAHRLVTLVGPGGAGKTRLALEVAHRIAASFADGAYFADLSTVSEGDALADALSRALRVPTELASKGFAGVKTMLRNRRALLVLDNCEQILDSCSWLVSSLLDDAPDVRILATSRAAFGLSAERCYVLRPLTPEYAARLFLERARSTGWDGSGLAEAEARIASVCERLDRLPLALELAAGMLGTLSLANVEEQIRERLDQIESRDPTTPARHRSLNDVIRWSVGLLGEDARTAFVRLAVFSGSFSAAAAKAVCSVDLGTLAALVATSVLVRDDALESRFVYLNGVGDYARRLFDADPEAPALRDAHAAWYAALAARSQEPAFCKSERAWLREIDRDFANVVRALEWSLLSGGDPQNGLKLAIGAGLYFLRRGFLQDGVSWLENALGRTLPDSAERAHLEMQLSYLEVPRANFARALERARAARTFFETFGPDLELGRALNCEGFSLIYAGRAAEARSLFERALEPAQRAGDVRTEAHNLSNIAYLLSESQPAEAQRLYLRALRRYTDAGDNLNIAKTHNSLAAFEYTAGRYEAANDYLERALAIHRADGNAPAIAGAVGDLGDVALMQGLTSRARDCYAEALRFLERLEEVLSYATLLCGIAGIAADANRPRDAARLIGAARFSDNGTPAPARVRVRTHVLARVEAALGPEACALEIALGSELPLAEAVRLARSVLEDRPA